MNGLSCLHLELTSRCNKQCFMCGRRKLEREYPELCNWGDMPYEKVESIASQVPKGIVVQLHNNGEPLMYDHLGDAMALFHDNIRSFNTNGKLLMAKADEIIGNLETLCISVIENDPEGDEQYEQVCSFLGRKGVRKPSMVYRLLGNVDKAERWGSLPGVVARRVLHSPDGSRDYAKPVTIPEIGICLDLLTHMAIDRFGDVSVCVRFDPDKKGVLGNVQYHTLDSLWNCTRRRWFIEQHLDGLRHTMMLCGKCDYWGVPRGD